MGNENSRRGSDPSCEDTNVFRVMNNIQPLKFHAVHGEYVTLSKSDTVATRFEGFCKGIAFGNRPVAVNEHIYIKFSDISSSWSGALRIGFTSSDPTTYRNRLPKYACPYMTDIPGNWARALAERMVRKNSVLFYYVNNIGEVHYGFDNEEKGIFFSGVNTAGKLWALLDIYGNTVQVEFVDPCLLREPQIEHVSNVNSIERSSSPGTNDEIFPRVKSTLPILCFHDKHGNNVSVVKSGKAVSRQLGKNGYAFSNRPLKTEEVIIIQISEVTHFLERILFFGVTSCNPVGINELPDEPDDLFDRPEYWVVHREEAEQVAVNDVFAFVIREDGALMFRRNFDPLSIVAFVDNTLPLWFFIDLFGSAAELTLSGSYERVEKRVSEDQVISLYMKMMKKSDFVLPNPEQLEDRENLSALSANDSNNECVVCCEAGKNSALYRCGHACMCYDCAYQLWHSANPYCPLCRDVIMDVIKIYK